MNTPLIRFARYFATVKHAGQSYAGGLPYTHHLAAVEAVLRRFGFENEDLLAACWLHDSMEDQGVKKRDLREMFTERVADLVDAVTNGPGENRKARQVWTYPKIRATPGAIALKLADRIANVEQGGSEDMYRKEYEDFRRSLYTPAPERTETDPVLFADKVENMWKHLDKLLA